MVKSKKQNAAGQSTIRIKSVQFSCWDNGQMLQQGTLIYRHQSNYVMHDQTIDFA